MTGGEADVWHYALCKGVWISPTTGRVERNYTRPPGMDVFKTHEEARSWLVKEAKTNEMLAKAVALSVKLRMGLRLEF